jgi:hypothetical protein
MSLEIREWDGQPITEAGAYSNVDMSYYHGRLVAEPEDSASRSLLWTFFDESAAHAGLRHYARDDADKAKAAESEALLLGRGSHHMLLGEADFSEHFVFHPETYPEGAEYPSMIGAEKKWNGNSKWCKAWMKEQRDRKRAVLKPDHMDAIRGMANGLYANPLVRAGVLNGHIETTMVARDPKTGIWLKIRPDATPTDSGDYADLKTIADISDEGIEKAIGETGIFLQGAMTRRVTHLLGWEFNSFSPVFIEKKEPFWCRVHTLTDADLDLGDVVLDTTLAAYKRCLERGVWPGPGGEQVDAAYAQMTPWKRRQIEHKISLLQKEAKL